jgi:lysozyme
MKLNEKGYNLIKQFEGFSDRPYLCSAGKPTIGFGNTFYPNGVKVKLTDKQITREYADEMLRFVADGFAKDVASLVKSIITQNQFNALVSFAYNVGSDIDADTIPEGLGDSTLLKKVNANPNDPTIKNEFLKWDKSKGVVSKGLLKRRTAEANLYFTV